MGLFGLFGKKQPAQQNFSQQVPVAPEQTGSTELPDIPPIEDLDLPPPPAYPESKSIPEQASSPPSEFFASQTPFELGNEPSFEKPAEPEEPKIEVEEFKPPERAPPRGSLFVRVEDYRTMLESTGRIKDNLGESADLVMRLNELKNEEDKEFEKWRMQLEDIQRKLTYIDKVIFEAR
ncbi:MAG: hypothetical protein ABIF10_06650 [Candidatus Woesearchaeota archaeon]